MVQHIASDAQQDPALPMVMVVAERSADRERIGDAFEADRFQTLTVSSIAAARSILETTAVDLAVVDLGLNQDTLSFCREQGRAESPMVMLLSSSTDITDQIIALEVGADDWVNRELEPRALLARASALLRRRVRQSARVESSAAWTIHFERKLLVTASGRPQRLSHRDVELLRILVRAAGTVVSSAALSDELGFGDSQADVRTSICRLRRKFVAAGFDPIQTVYGAGYLYDRNAGSHQSASSVAA